MLISEIEKIKIDNCQLCDSTAKFKIIITDAFVECSGCGRRGPVFHCKEFINSNKELEYSEGAVNAINAWNRKLNKQMMFNIDELKIIYHIIDCVYPDLKKSEYNRFEIGDTEYIEKISLSENEYSELNNIREKIGDFFFLDSYGTVPPRDQ